MSGALPQPRLRMPWGKFKGVFIEDLKTSYLEWLFLNNDEDVGPPKLARAIEAELAKRQSRERTAKVVALRDLATRWHRKMAKRYPKHPNLIAFGRDLIERLIEEAAEDKAQANGKRADWCPF